MTNTPTHPHGQPASGTPWHWTYHPISNDAIALIDPDGNDAMLATDDDEGHVGLRFSSQATQDFILNAIRSHAQLTADLLAARSEKAMGEEDKKHLTAELVRVVLHASGIGRKTIHDPMTPVIARDLSWALKALDEHGDQAELSRHTSLMYVREDVARARDGRAG